jgi:chemotaxis protein CheY-P-specific phosphatase CheC
MRSVLDASLRQAAVNTFEQLVFLLPDIPPDESQRALPVMAVASIAFRGPAAGLLQVHACEGLLSRLAGNMLGEELDDEALQLDALGEIANIICGQVFPHLDPFRAFEQQPPQVSASGSTVPRLLEPSASIELGLECSRADVMLWIFEDAA